MKKNVFFVIALCFIVIGTASAETAESSGAYKTDSCKVEYLKGISSYMETTFGSAGLADKVDVLEATDLPALASRTTIRDYHNYKVQSFWPHWNTAVNAVIDAKKNLTLKQKQSLWKEAADLLSGYESCVSDGLTTMLDNKIKGYNAIISAGELAAANLEAKGADPEKMNAVLSDAKSFMSELEAAASSAETAQEKWDVYRSYCLNNGCDGSSASTIEVYNFHFTAKSAIASFSSILDALEENAGSDAAGKIADARSSIQDAQSVLDERGRNKMSVPQGVPLWNALKEARADILDIMNLNAKE